MIKTSKKINKKHVNKINQFHLTIYAVHIRTMSMIQQFAADVIFFYLQNVVHFLLHLNNFVKFM